MNASNDAYDEKLEEEKHIRMRSILGDGRMNYLSLIDQLIFMQETHSF